VTDPAAHLAAQAIGAAAAALSLFAGSQLKDRRLLAFSMASAALFACHYALLAAATAALMAAVSAARYAARLAFGGGPRTALPFAAAALAAAAASWDGPLSLLPAAGTLASVLTSTLCRGAAMRAGMLASAGCWMAFNLAVGSVGGAVVNAASLCMLSVAVLRLLRRGATEGAP
jgi:hypothetical protein